MEVKSRVSGLLDFLDVIVGSTSIGAVLKMTGNEVVLAFIQVLYFIGWRVELIVESTVFLHHPGDSTTTC